jgi:hypothetical protein
MTEHISGELRQLIDGHYREPVMRIEWDTRRPDLEVFKAVNFPLPLITDTWWDEAFLPHLATITGMSGRYMLNMHYERPSIFTLRDKTPERWTGFELRDWVVRTLRSTLPDPYRRFRLVYAMQPMKFEKRVLH